MLREVGKTHRVLRTRSIVLAARLSALFIHLVLAEVKARSWVAGAEYDQTFTAVAVLGEGQGRKEEGEYDGEVHVLRQGERVLVIRW